MNNKFFSDSDSIDSINFIKHIETTLRYCGIVSIQLQGNVKNIGKNVSKRETDSERLKSMREAKTKIDETIQDILLVCMEKLNIKYNFHIDAEEVSLFNQNVCQKHLDGNILVIDPIDGTLEYLEGYSSYSICLGWHNSGDMQAAVVYFPSKDIIYFCTNNTSYYADEFLRNGFKNASLLESAIPINSKQIYFNNRVPEDLLRELKNMGFTLLSDEKNKIGVPDVLLSCLTGKTLCYLSHTRQIRDILLGAIIAKTTNGYATNWTGEDLGWPQTPRLPRGLFGCGEPQQNIYAILRKYL